MKYQIMILVSLFVIFCVSCGNESIKKVSRDGSPAEKIILKVAHNGKEQHPFQKGFEKFKEVLEAETEGVVEVQIFPVSQLASEGEANQMVKLGLLSASAAGSGGLASFVPEVELFNLPFIFRDLQHFYRVLDGPVGRQVAEKIEKKLNCVVLGYWFAGIRNVWNKKKPIQTPDDLKGLKIRVMESAIMVDAFNALSAQATPLSWSQLYPALQLGVVDGAETDYIDLIQERLYEQTEYVSHTNHMYLPIALIFSKKQFDKLPPDIQDAVLKAGRASVIAEREVYESLTNDLFIELKNLGIQFNEVDKALFQEKIEHVYQNNAEKVGGMELIEAVQRQ